MPILDTVRTYLSGSEQVVAECRHCGTTVEAGVKQCPVCDKETIARYHVA